MSRKILALFLTILILFLTGFAFGQTNFSDRKTIVPVTGIRASNPNILPQGQAILNYLDHLSRSKDHPIVSGQWISGPNAWPQAYNLFVENLHQATGKWVAMLGSDYLGKEPATLQQDQALTNILINYWKAGGLITLTWSVDNPWYRQHTEEYCKNVPKPCVPGNLTDLRQPATPAGAYFKNELDDLAANLQTLQAAGVIVLFRPFHEMNGSWFWWGAKTPQTPTQAEFKALWQYTYNYLTKQKRLNNLLWVFSPNNSDSEMKVYDWGGMIQPAPYYYPGDQYVDITGLDVYVDSLGNPTYKNEDPSKYTLPTYTSMLALGKPFGLAEFGPMTGSKKDFDYDGILHNVSEAYPGAGFFMGWQDGTNNYLSIVSNPNPERLMNDPLIITRDALHY